MSEAGNVASGAQGDLNYATFSGDGVVGRTLNDVSNGINEAVCITLGPHFLQGRLQSHTCPNGIFLSNIFESWTIFCEYFNDAAPHIKECLSPSSIDLDGGVFGLFHAYGRLGKCCRTCEVSITYKMRISNAQLRAATSAHVSDQIPIV